MSDLHNHLDMAAGSPDGRLDLDDLHTRATARHRRRRRLQATGVVGAMAVLVLAAALSLATRHPGTPVKVAAQPPATASGVPAEPQPGWHPLPDAPIAGRRNAVTAWTGTEVVVVGGSITLPDASCPRSSERPLCSLSRPQDPTLWMHDGAAYDPATNAWHPIAPLPDGFLTSHSTGMDQSPVAVLDGKVYVLGWAASSPTTSRLASYDPSTNRWSLLPAPSASSSPWWWALTTYGDKLVAYAPLGFTKTSSYDPTGYHDRVYEPGTGTWSDLPIDPISEADGPTPATPATPAIGREMIGFDDKLYEFATFSFASTATGNIPAEQKIAVYDGHSWQEFSKSTGMNGGTWQVTGDHFTMVNIDATPAFACPSGAPRIEQQRQSGLTFDPSSNTFDSTAQFPASASQILGLPGICVGIEQLTIVGNGQSVALTTPLGALILDPTSNMWITTTGPDDKTLQGFSTVWAGNQLFRWGGGIVDYGDGTVNPIKQGWIWTPRTEGSGAASTTSSVAPTTTAPTATTDATSPGVASPSTSTSPTTTSSDTIPPTTLAPGTTFTPPTSTRTSSTSPAGKSHATH